jgi:hypothetical protein
MHLSVQRSHNSYRRGILTEPYTNEVIQQLYLLILHSQSIQSSLRMQNRYVTLAFAALIDRKL